MSPLIRPEDRADFAAIHDVVTLAFGRESEARLVETLRAAPAFVPELSLVAEVAGRVVGHVLFTPITIRTADARVPAMALAPVAVRPELQKSGVGSALIRHGLEACRRRGDTIVVVLGHRDYYPRFGFKRASTFGIAAPFPVNDASFMVVALQEGGLAGVRGVVEYPEALAAV